MKRVIAFLCAAACAFFVLKAYAQDTAANDLASQVVITKPAVSWKFEHFTIANGLARMNINYFDEDGNIVRNEDIELRDSPASCSVGCLDGEDPVPCASAGDCSLAGGVWTPAVTDWTQVKNYEVNATKVTVELSKGLKQKIKQIKGW